MKGMTFIAVACALTVAQLVATAQGEPLEEPQKRAKPTVRSILDGIDNNKSSAPSFEAFDGSPFFTVLSGQARQPANQVSIFISPSCPYCQNLTLDVLGSILSGERWFDNASVGFALIPRKSRDIPVIAGLMCVGVERFPAAVIAYYEELRTSNGFRAIADSTMRRVYLKTLRRFGVADTLRVQCESDQRAAEAIALFTRMGIEHRKQDSIPAVFLNSDYHPVISFRELKGLMR